MASPAPGALGGHGHTSLRVLAGRPGRGSLTRPGERSSAAGRTGCRAEPCTGPRRRVGLGERPGLPRGGWGARLALSASPTCALSPRTTAATGAPPRGAQERVRDRRGRGLRRPLCCERAARDAGPQARRPRLQRLRVNVQDPTALRHAGAVHGALPAALATPARWAHSPRATDGAQRGRKPAQVSAGQRQAKICWDNPKLCIL